MTRRRYRLTDPGLIEPLLDGLRDRLTLDGDDEVAVSLTVHDTFDWRVWGDGGLLVHERGPDAGALVWLDRSGGGVQGRLELDEVPSFAWDLPSGALRDRLRRVLDVRALRPLATVVGTRRELRLLDDEDKTTARLLVQRIEHPGSGADLRLEVVRVRGYDEEADELSRLLGAQFAVTATVDDPLIAALRAQGLTPGDYTSKLRLTLDPEATALEAWVAVLDELRRTIVANEDGTRADLDSEFLHDLRVAVRRSRSVLSQSKGVLPASVLSRFRADFAWLGRATSPTRDLDVFLLDVPRFESALPPALEGELEPLRRWLEAQQRVEQEKLASELDSPRYASTMSDWAVFLAHPHADAQASDAHRAAQAVAGERTWKAFRRVLRDGRRIDDTSPGEQLHELRKDAKRLRYLIECFGSLFPGDQLAPTVRSLKALQDTLGRHQDGDVQGAALRAMADQLQADEAGGAATVLAMGSVLQLVDDGRRAAREEFAERFAAFDTHDHRQALRRVLAPADGSRS